jgi:hypothetical protein
MRHTIIIKNDSMMKTKAYIIFALVLTVLFTACEKSAIPDRTFVADGAKICFINLSVDLNPTTGTAIKTNNEFNLFFNAARVTTQTSTVVGKLRGIPYRSSYPGVVVATPAATTAPTSYIAAEYFNATPGQTSIVAKDTALYFPTDPAKDQDTLFMADFNFEKNKYYSIFATGMKDYRHPANVFDSLSSVIVEDDITAFRTLKKVKVRAVNAIYGVAGGAVDVWLIHQAATTELGRAPFKLASALSYKNVTAFSDTITSGSYRFVVVVAGTVCTPVNPVADPVTLSFLGKSYSLTVPAGTTIVALSSATTFSERTTYSMLLYGLNTKTGVMAPYASLFRNRLL